VIEEAEQVGDRPPVAIDTTVELIEGYKFYFSSVNFDTAMRLRYVTFPPVSEDSQTLEDVFFIDGDAQDDCGTPYTFVGGAHGLSESSPCTDGVLSFSPLPDKNAKRITFAIYAQKGDEKGSCEFTVLVK